MRKKHFARFLFLFLTAIFCFAFTGFSQTTVTGIVRSSTDEVLQGVSVSLKGDATATSTNSDGAYSIRVPDSRNNILVFTMTGYSPREIRVDGSSVINVNLEPLIQELDQVVVVGYGTQKKSSLTGSVAVLDKAYLSERPFTQTSQALQGKMTDVTVTQNFGLPGEDGGTIRIRGLGTLNNNAPLVLIDGVPGDINDVNPNDIDNLSVLKDAAAASIYGSRAANGVILITTKRASRNEKLAVSYNALVTVQQATDLPKIVSGLDYMLLKNEENVNSGLAPIFTQADIDNYAANAGTEPYFSTDWFKLAMKESALQHSHNVTLRGGGDKMSTLVSLNYLKQDGLVNNSQFVRKSVRINNSFYANNRLTFTLNGFLNREESEVPNGNGTGPGPLFKNMYEIPAIYPGLWSDGSFGEGWQGSNPYAFVQVGGRRVSNATTMRLDLRASYKILDWLSAEVAYTPTYTMGNLEAKVKKYDFKRIDGTVGTFPSQPTQVTDNTSSVVDNFYQAILRVNKSFGQHRVTALGGVEQITSRSEGFFASRQNYVLQEYMVLNSGDPNTQVNGNTNATTPTEWELFSQFGQVKYEYDGRYFLEGLLRYDGSSRFSSAYKQYGLFPSVSAAWRISQESFLRNSRGISNLKLSASWGQLGNQAVPGGNYPYLSLINLNQPYYFGQNPSVGAAQTTIANELVTWETSTQLNGVLEFGFLDNKLTGSLEVYKKNTKDILYARDIPSTIGLEAAPQNIAEVENKGWNLMLSWNERKRVFRYGVDVIFSDVRNKVVDVKNKPSYGRNVIFEGEEYQAFYGYEVIGIYRSAEDLAKYPTINGNVKLGDLIYKDQNKDGIIDAVNDKKIIGSNIPRYTYGVTIRGGYKQFDLSVFMQGVGKKNLYFLALDNGANANFATFQLDRFVPDDPSTYTTAKYPRLAVLSANPNYEDNSFHLLNGAYLRCKNVTLAYNVADALVSRWRMTGIRLFVAATNLFTIDNIRINTIDPEAPSTTNASSYAPNLKTYSVGVDIKF